MHIGDILYPRVQYHIHIWDIKGSSLWTYWGLLREKLRNTLNTSLKHFWGNFSTSWGHLLTGKINKVVE